jgi:hypothetical protein
MTITDKYMNPGAGKCSGAKAERGGLSRLPACGQGVMTDVARARNEPTASAGEDSRIRTKRVEPC